MIRIHDERMHIRTNEIKHTRSAARNQAYLYHGRRRYVVYLYHGPWSTFIDRGHCINNTWLGDGIGSRPVQGAEE